MYFIAYTLLYHLNINIKYFKNSLHFKNSQKNMFWPRSSTVAYCRPRRSAEQLTDPLAGVMHVVNVN